MPGNEARRKMRRMVIPSPCPRPRSSALRKEAMTRKPRNPFLVLPLALLLTAALRLPAATAGAYTWTGGHTESGVREASVEWTLAEGCTRPGFDTWLCLANPGDSEATAEVEFLLSGSAPVTRSYAVAPRSRSTVLVDEAVGEGEDLGFHVTSQVPVVVERSMYFNYAHFPSDYEFPIAFTLDRGLRISSPIAYPELIGLLYHEASLYDSDNRVSNALAMQPVGGCLADGNPGRLPRPANPRQRRSLLLDRVHPVARHPLHHRGGRGGPGGTGGARAGHRNRARGPPLPAVRRLSRQTASRSSQTATPTLVRGVFPPRIDQVSPGDRVTAGLTVVGTVNDLARYFRSDIADYNGDDGNHDAHPGEPPRMTVTAMRPEAA